MPGCAGSYGITAGHTPNVSQLMPGVSFFFFLLYLSLLISISSNTNFNTQVVEIFENRAEEATEKYFVAGTSFFFCSRKTRNHSSIQHNKQTKTGGYAFYMPDGTLKIAATEACKIDDLDAAVVQKQLDDSKARMGSATPDPRSTLHGSKSRQTLRWPRHLVSIK